MFAESVLLKNELFVLFQDGGRGVKLFSLINEDTRANTETVRAFSFLITFLWFNRP